MRLGVITDVHIAPAGADPISWHSPLMLETAGERYTAALARLSREDVDAIAVLGDLTHLGDAASADELVARTADLDVPVLWVLGNHDVVPSVAAIPEALERAGGGPARLAGPEPHVVGGVAVYGVGVAPAPGVERYQAEVAPRPDGPAIVLTHFPVLSREEEFGALGLKYAGDLIDRDLVAANLREHAVLVLAGHLHARGVRTEGGILQLSFGALVEEPFDTAVVDVERDLVSVDVRFVAGRGPWPVVDLPDRSRFVRETSGWVRDR